MIITFSGTPGSGKSTIAKLISEKLSWKRYYMGGMRREMARKRGMTLAEYNKLGESDPSTDEEVDLYQKKLGETEDNIIVEGRTSHFFIPKSFSIFIKCDVSEAAKRIWKELQEKPDGRK